MCTNSDYECVLRVYECVYVLPSLEFNWGFGVWLEVVIIDDGMCVSSGVCVCVWVLPLPIQLWVSKFL